MHTLRKASISLAAAALILSPALSASAQVAAVPISAYACRTVTLTLSWGSQDYFTQGEVSVLQQFLAAQGFYRGPVIGIFGPATFAAVRGFQAAHGIPTTGTVGPLTRAAMAQIGCGTNPYPLPAPIPTPSAPTILSVSPTQGPVGTTVTITGYGFGQTNTILFDGMTAVDNAQVTSSMGAVCPAIYPSNCTSGIRQTITFVVPDYLRPYCPPGAYCLLYAVQTQPRAYQVSVKTDAGNSSNAMQYVVTGNGQGSQSLSIQGVDAPSQLSLYQQGTWTVRTNNSGQGLHYSVVWGDEYMTGNASIAYPGPSQVQSTATFTHAYSRTGTFTPLLTVSDDYGHSVTTSASVVVTPIY